MYHMRNIIGEQFLVNILNWASGGNCCKSSGKEKEKPFRGHKQVETEKKAVIGWPELTAEMWIS